MQDSNLGCQELCETRRVFLVPHFIYLTLPYLHNLRYVNLSNIRYLFTYRTSSQTPNLLYLYLTYRHSGLSFHHQLAGLVSSIDQSVPSSPHRFHRPHLSVKSCHLPYLEINLNSSSSLHPDRIIYGTNQWSFILHPEKQNF